MFFYLNRSCNCDSIARAIGNQTEEIEKNNLREFNYRLFRDAEKNRKCFHEYDPNLSGHEEMKKYGCVCKKNKDLAKNIMACTKWISVKDRLPLSDGDYLVNVKYLSESSVEYWVTILHWDSQNYKKWQYASDYGYKDYEDDDSDNGCSITHWMPLPEPPNAD